MKLTISLAVVLCLVPLVTGDLTEVMTQAVHQTTSLLQKGSGPCKRCTAFLTDVRDKLDSETFQDLMVSYVYSVLCLELPSIVHKPCRVMANQTVRSMLSDYASLIDPDTFCKNNMFCSPTFEEDFKELADDVLMFIEMIKQNPTWIQGHWTQREYNLKTCMRLYARKMRELNIKTLSKSE